MSQDDFNRMVLNVEEARRIMGISRGLMYEAIHQGEIPSINIGRRILIPRAALMQLLEQTSRKENSEQRK